MTFTKQKKVLLRPQKSRALSTFILALFVAAAFFVPFIVSGNGYFIFYGDFNVQQIPFYQLCHQAVRDGNFGWNFYTDLGTNFIGSYSFYLFGSPFFWLTIPFPNSFVPYLMGPLLILKFALAALFAYFYISRFTRKTESARIGALLYAFSGFSVYNIFFNHFHEAILIFPLLLLSLELLITENKRGVFALCVAISAVMNYYFFFGMVVFCIIYWFIRVTSGAFKFKFGRFMTLIFEAVCGVALAAFILFPSVVMLLGNSRVDNLQTGWSAILHYKEQRYLYIIQSFFFPPDIPSRPVFFPDANAKWSSVAGWLPVFSMTGVIGFLYSKKKSWLKRVICTCIFMAMVPVLNSLFSALNTSYYTRWFYMPILMMALCTAQTLEDSTVDWKKGYKITSVITVVIALVIGLFPQKDGENLYFGLYTDAGDYTSTYFYRFIAAVAIAFIGLLVCRLIMMIKSKKAFYRTALASVCIMSVIMGSVFILEGSQHSYDINDVMIDQLIEGEVTLPNEDDPDNFRVDFYDGVDNSGMYLNMPTINAFHSVVSPSIMEFYEFIGVTRDVASRPSTEYLSLRMLLSVKYLLNRVDGDRFVDDTGNTEMYGFDYVSTNGGYYIYENENYIPYGFSYDYYITETELKNLYKGKARSDMMLKAIVLPDEYAETYNGNMKHYTDSDIKAYTTEDPDTDEYVISSATTHTALAADAKHLALSSAKEFSISGDGFTATVEREESSLVFFSIPYDSGWTATVDGKKANIIKANIGFMAVEVPAGISEITFDYTTPLLKEGITISGSALILLIIYLLISLSVLKKKQKEEVYPEGDELIKQWQQANLDEINEDLLELPAKEDIDYLDFPAEEENTQSEKNGKYFSGFHIDVSQITEDEQKNIDNQEQKD